MNIQNPPMSSQGDSTMRRDVMDRPTQSHQAPQELRRREGVDSNAVEGKPEDGPERQRFDQTLEQAERHGNKQTPEHRATRVEVTSERARQLKGQCDSDNEAVALAQVSASEVQRDAKRLRRSAGRLGKQRMNSASILKGALQRRMAGQATKMTPQQLSELAPKRGDLAKAAETTSPQLDSMQKADLKRPAVESERKDLRARKPASAKDKSDAKRDVSKLTQRKAKLPGGIDRGKRGDQRADLNRKTEASNAERKANPNPLKQASSLDVGKLAAQAMASQLRRVGTLDRRVAAKRILNMSRANENLNSKSGGNTSDAEAGLKSLMGETSSATGSTLEVNSSNAVERIHAQQSLQSVRESIMDHLATRELQRANTETRLTVRLGEMGGVQIKLKMVGDAGGAQRLQVAIHATDAQTTNLLKQGVAAMAEALESKGYTSPMIEVSDAGASETKNDDGRPSNFDQNTRDGREQSADDEAFSAFIGRRHRDNAAAELKGWEK
jgi:hypothetical protein